MHYFLNTTAHSFEGIRILVVEDNQMNQLFIRDTFNQWKLEFELAESGIEALTWLQRDRFDLVLLNIQMPLMNGYEVVNAIRHQLNMELPVIAMTDRALATEREKCLSSGMNDYISKPTTGHELHNLLDKHLAGKKAFLDSIRAAMHCIDFDFLFDMVMGNGLFLKNIINQFLRQFPGEMEELRKRVISRNKERIAAQAHHIQSTVAPLGRKSPFFKQLETIEHMAQNNTSVEDIAVAFSALEEYHQLLMQDINSILNANF